MAFGDLLRKATRTEPDSTPMSRATAFHTRVEPAPSRAPIPPTPTAKPSPRPIISATKPVLDPQHVIRMVAQADNKPNVSRSGGNSEGYIHWSSIIDGCAREHCISQQHGLPFATSPGGSMKMLWRIGRAVEKHIRDSVIEARDFDNVYGRWTCKCEADSYTGVYQRGRTCQVCRRATSFYKEPVLRSDLHKVVGSPDLTLIEMGWLMPVEIKSMNKEQFDNLDAPLHDHILQACGYHNLYEQLGFPMLGKVSIVYGRKDFKFGGSLSVYKEFHRNYDDYAYQVEKLMMQGQSMYAHNEERTLPDRICNAPSLSRAKGCPRCTLCFSL